MACSEQEAFFDPYLLADCDPYGGAHALCNCFGTIQTWQFLMQDVRA